MNLKEKQGYSIVNRKQEIDNLICWACECGTGSQNDKELIKEDLKMLMNWHCKNIYSSESTNEYIEIKN